MQRHLFTGTPLDNVAIDALREFAPKDGTPLRVAYSGGKDSCVILDLARRSGLPFEAHYSFVCLDPPELRAFIREQARDPQNRIVIDYPTRSLASMAREKQFMPRRGARWCCELMKHANEPPESTTTILGLRWAESKKRSSRGLFESRRSGAGKIINPIIGWLNTDVWDYMRERRLPYCHLYDEGEKRLGCILCPLARNERPAYQTKARRDMERWPGITRLWRRVAEIVWEYHQADFADPEALFDWWIRLGPTKRTGSYGQGDDGECGLFGPPVEIADNLEPLRETSP